MVLKDYDSKTFNISDTLTDDRPLELRTKKERELGRNLRIHNGSGTHKRIEDVPSKESIIQSIEDQGFIFDSKLSW